MFFLWNCMRNFHQILHGAFCRKGIENFFEWFRAIEQDGCHANILQKQLKIFFSRTKKVFKLKLGI